MCLNVSTPIRYWTHYAFQLDYVFQPKIFGELQNAQASVLPYDGLNPKPPTDCYLKPHYFDVQTSYSIMSHAARYEQFRAHPDVRETPRASAARYERH